MLARFHLRLRFVTEDMERKSDPEAVAAGATGAIADPGDVQLLGEMRSNS